MQQGLMFHNSFEEVGIQVIKEMSLLNVELMDHPFWILWILHRHNDDADY
jgi:hypothetical protein